MDAEWGGRVIVDPIPRAGTENLAIDWMLLSVAAGEPENEELNESAGVAKYRKEASTEVPILRFYRWRPTLSLGHFQTEDSIPKEFAHTDGLEITRRPSGGGAIVHDQEWTYALVLPPKSYIGLLSIAESEDSKNEWNNQNTENGVKTSSTHRSPVALVRQIHWATVAMLRAEYGLNAQLAENLARKANRTAAEFLCFQRRAAEDVVVISNADQDIPEGVTERITEKMEPYGAKVLGSAMRMRGGAVLIHGSFLMRRSEFAPTLPGIFDLVTKSEKNAWESQWELVQRWQRAIVYALCGRQRPQRPTGAISPTAW